MGDWNAHYEKITDMIVPRSSQTITQDQDYVLCTVTLFKKVVDEFKLHARERKFVVREFVYNEEELAAGKNEITKLVTDKKKQFVSSDGVMHGREVSLTDGNFSVYIRDRWSDG